MPYPLTGNPLSAVTATRNPITSATLTPIRTTAGLVGAPRTGGLTVYPSAAAAAVVTPPTTGQIWPRSASPGTQGPQGVNGVSAQGVLVLAAADSIPVGTPTGTVIFRTP